MRRFVSLLLCFVMMTMTAEAAMVLEYNGEKHNYTGSVYKLYVNGKAVSTPLEPIIFNDRALVPAREVFEAMGAEVGYVASTREITISMGESFTLMQIDSPYVFVNGTRKTIPDGVTPMLIAKEGESAKTMVPVRFVSESLGMLVNFDGDNGRIIVNNPAQDFPEELETPAPTATPAPKTTITGVSAKADGDSVTVSVNLKNSADKISGLTFIESSGVLYCDIYSANYTASNNTSIELGLVKSVRLGLHDEYTRVAVDTVGATGYYKKLSSDGKTLMITVTGEAGAVSPSPGASPSASPSPTASPQPTATPAPTPVPQAHLTGEKIIVLDAGHGGSDPGAQSTHGDTKYVEKEINLAVAKKVRDILKKSGVRVEMTRTGDTYPTLTDRSDMANELGAAMFISIHSNSIENNPGVSGIEIFYAKTNNGSRYGLTSKELATDIYKNMIKNTGAAERGVKTEQHVVTRTSEMPAVLIELGFLTNEEEAANMADGDYQDLLASAIADAVLDNLASVKIPPDAE